MAKAGEPEAWRAARTEPEIRLVEIDPIHAGGVRFGAGERPDVKRAGDTEGGGPRKLPSKGLLWGCTDEMGLDSHPLPCDNVADQSSSTTKKSELGLGMM